MKPTRPLAAPIAAQPSEIMSAISSFFFQFLFQPLFHPLRSSETDPPREDEISRSQKSIVEFEIEVAGVKGLDTDVSVLAARRKAFSVGMECNRVDRTEVTLEEEEEDYLTAGIKILGPIGQATRTKRARILLKMGPPISI